MRTADFPTTTVAFYKGDSDDSFYICEMLHVPRVGDFVQLARPGGDKLMGKINEVDWGLDFTQDNPDGVVSGMQVVHIYISE